MSTALADRLFDARRHAFVGRRRALEIIEPLLARDPGEGGVIYLHGPSGVGKTTLLRHLAVLGADAGRAVEWREVSDPAEFPAEPGLLLLVDAADMVAFPVRWLTEDLPARLPAGAVAIVAGRAAPPQGWRTDHSAQADPGHQPDPAGRAGSADRTGNEGWRGFFRAVALGNLEPAESEQLLGALGVPERRFSDLLASTGGHPLALVIAADLSVRGVAAAVGERPPDAPPQVVAELLGGLLDTVPSATHRAALEVCAQVRATTEPLLAALLDVPDARELFEWARELPVMDSGPRGLFPHDLARDALCADLRWHDPDRYADLHRRAGVYYQSRFSDADDAARRDILADFAYLHRDNATLGPYLGTLSPAAPNPGGPDPGESDPGGPDPEGPNPGGPDTGGPDTGGPDTGGTKPGGPVSRPGREADHRAVIAMVRRHEGPASATIASHWLARQPQALTVVEEPGGDLAGFSLHLTVNPADPADRAADPAIARLAAPGVDERLSYLRFWMSAAGYQDMSDVATAITLQAVRRYLTCADLAVSMIAYAEPDFWATASRYLDFAPAPAADFTVDGHTYGVFTHDWRTAPALLWLDLLASRETSAQPPAIIPAAAATPVRVLDFDEFAAGVRAALRDLGRPDRLNGCALAHSRVVTAHAAGIGPGTAGNERGAVVQAVVREAAAELAESPRDRQDHQALHHAYLRPAGSQQHAAGLLDMPMSTFRRHLTAGIGRLTELLWRRELTD